MFRDGKGAVGAHATMALCISHNPGLCGIIIVFVIVYAPGSTRCIEGSGR
ncbi:Hypothetical protein ETEE_0359 [Edwardsiella anguillarum ET080813]|uniref:Uncharacterized protein n=1 Tax=Edwardsiella anguillarum ET080813 TaxID=667120 RepID=A0A076LIX2_9GAMM|nr:Hypothetical protein ETEE_0359 [Edwardsiella anguillarum ET080813]